jgi:hypothetical protein
VNVLLSVLRVLWWALACFGLLTGLTARLLWAALVVLGQAVVFVIEPLDELVTAGLGTAPVLPRMRRWWHLVAGEWRARRSGAIDAEVVDADVIDAEVVEGVWR